MPPLRFSIAPRVLTVPASAAGVTCGQLKLHLGLAVPVRASKGGKGQRRRSTAPQRCATLRVADQSGGWAEGELTAFDDAYEHEVRNECDQERVVFQMVMAEEGLWRNVWRNSVQAEPRVYGQ